MKSFPFLGTGDMGEGSLHTYVFTLSGTSDEKSPQVRHVESGVVVAFIHLILALDHVFSDIGFN